MSVSLFDNVERKDVRIIQPGETDYEYLNRCSHEVVQRVRDFMDELASEYLDMHGRKAFDSVATKYRSRDNGQHAAPHLELILNRLLVRNGCAVKSVEPILPNGSRPDYLAAGTNDDEFYVEARVVTRISDIGWIESGNGMPKEVNPEPAIRARIIEKMSKYGDPGKPLILAINTLDPAADRLAFEDILLGTFGVEVSLNIDGSTTTRVVRGMENGDNDAILALDSSENVSAYLFMRCCNHGNEACAWYCLYHNPRARRPLRASFPDLLRAIPKPVRGKTAWYWHYRNGKPLGDLLGLPPGWPQMDIEISEKTLRRLKLMWG